MPSESPYPGPRPFKTNQEKVFHGREREKRELRSLLIAHRAVLLYAQSGAGKTSLINAGLLPGLRREGIEALPVVRVGLPIPKSVAASEIRNIYIFNVLVSWAGENADPRTLRSKSVTSFLHERAAPKGNDLDSTPRIIILDQLEELFTTYSERWAERQEFLDELAQALDQDPSLRILLCLREDHIAALDPYARLFPERLKTRYRLERLRRDAACLAIEKPIEHTPRKFAPGVVDQLVDELLKIRIEQAGGNTSTVVGEYVEPVQLQIVCENIWKNMTDAEDTVTSSHLKSYGNVDQALMNFYEKTLAATVNETHVSEADLRTWFEDHLITQAGTRGTVFSGPKTTGGIPNEAVAKLEDEHIIRAETRAGSRWYELTHDRFIDPIKKSNRPWRERFESERARREAERIRTEAMWKWGRIGAGLVALTVIISIWIVADARHKAKVELELKRKELELQQERKSRAKVELEARQRGEADTSYANAKKLLLKSDFAQALRDLEKARAAYETLNDQSKQIETLLTIGRIHALKDNPAEAKRVSDRVQSISRQVGDRGAEGQVFELLASLEEKGSRHEVAMQLYLEADRAYEDAGDHQARGRVLERRALYEESKERFSAALKIYDGALTSYRLASDQLGIERVKKAQERLAMLYASWGYLIDLHTSEIYELKGAEVKVGGNWGDIRNDIGFKSRYYSRRHLIIRREHTIEDLRSRNGTTINGQLLRYGLTAKLSDHDIITLANMKALQFSATLPQIKPNASSSTWAIFLDNASRTYHYLTDPEYALHLVEGKISLENRNTDAALMKLRWNNGKAEMFYTPDDWTILFTIKETDYDYRTYPLDRTEQWSDALTVPLKCVKLSKDGRKVVEEGPSFQIVLFKEPACCPE